MSNKLLSYVFSASLLFQLVSPIVSHAGISTGSESASSLSGGSQPQEEKPNLMDQGKNTLNYVTSGEGSKTIGGYTDSASGYIKKGSDFAGEQSGKVDSTLDKYTGSSSKAIKDGASTARGYTDDANQYIGSTIGKGGSTVNSGINSAVGKANDSLFSTESGGRFGEAYNSLGQGATSTVGNMASGLTSCVQGNLMQSTVGSINQVTNQMSALENSAQGVLGYRLGDSQYRKIVDDAQSVVGMVDSYNNKVQAVETSVEDLSHVTEYPAQIRSINSQLQAVSKKALQVERLEAEIRGINEVLESGELNDNDEERMRLRSVRALKERERDALLIEINEESKQIAAQVDEIEKTDRSTLANVNKSNQELEKESSLLEQTTGRLTQSSTGLRSAANLVGTVSDVNAAKLNQQAYEIEKFNSQLNGTAQKTAGDHAADAAYAMLFDESKEEFQKALEIAGTVNTLQNLKKMIDLLKNGEQIMGAYENMMEMVSAGQSVMEGIKIASMDISGKPISPDQMKQMTKSLNDGLALARQAEAMQAGVEEAEAFKDAALNEAQNLGRAATPQEFARMMSNLSILEPIKARIEPFTKTTGGEMFAKLQTGASNLFKTTQKPAPVTKEEAEKNEEDLGLMAKASEYTSDAMKKVKEKIKPVSDSAKAKMKDIGASASEAYNEKKATFNTLKSDGSQKAEQYSTEYAHAKRKVDSRLNEMPLDEIQKVSTDFDRNMQSANTIIDTTTGLSGDFENTTNSLTRMADSYSNMQPALEAHQKINNLSQTVANSGNLASAVKGNFSSGLEGLENCFKVNPKLLVNSLGNMFFDQLSQEITNMVYPYYAKATNIIPFVVFPMEDPGDFRRAVKATAKGNKVTYGKPTIDTGEAAQKGQDQLEAWEEERNRPRDVYDINSDIRRADEQMAALKKQKEDVDADIEIINLKLDQMEDNGQKDTDGYNSLLEKGKKLTRVSWDLNSDMHDVRRTIEKLEKEREAAFAAQNKSSLNTFRTALVASMEDVELTGGEYYELARVAQNSQLDDVANDAINFDTSKLPVTDETFKTQKSKTIQAFAKHNAQLDNEDMMEAFDAKIFALPMPVPQIPYGIGFEMDLGDFKATLNAPYKYECGAPPLGGLGTLWDNDEYDCLYERLVCWTVFGVKICKYVYTYLPGCDVTMEYKEPVAHVEVMGRNTESHLSTSLASGPLSELNAKLSMDPMLDGGESLEGDWGIGTGVNVMGGADTAYQARVYGTSPVGRVLSNLNPFYANYTMACDLGDVWKKWEYLTLPATPIPQFQLAFSWFSGDMSILALKDWYETWFDASQAGQVGLAPIPLNDLYTSELDKQNWNPRAIVGLGAIMQTPLGEDDFEADRTELLNHIFAHQGSGSDTVHGMVPGYCDRSGNKGANENNVCIGQLGALYPRGGQFYQYDSRKPLRHMMLIAQRALDRALEKGVFLEGENEPAEQGDKKGFKMDEDTSHGGVGYSNLEYSIEWPLKTDRYAVGTYPEGPIKNWFKGQLSNEIDAEGLVLTYWKDTKCCVRACCPNPPYEPWWTHVQDRKIWTGEGPRSSHPTYLDEEPAPFNEPEDWTIIRFKQDK